MKGLGQRLGVQPSLTFLMKILPLLAFICITAIIMFILIFVSSMVMGISTLVLLICIVMMMGSALSMQFWTRASS